MEPTRSPAGEASGLSHRPPPSNSDLLSSAKLIGSAFKSAVSHESDKINKGKVAGAAADVLGAAKHYGKLEEKNIAKYMDKAEGYLHSYHSSHPSSSGAASSPSATTTGQETSSGSSGSGYGNFIKLARGLFKKR